MENQLFNDYTSKIIRFINAYRHKCVMISEIIKDFRGFIGESEIMNIICYLSDNGYIVVADDRAAVTTQTRENVK